MELPGIPADQSPEDCWEGVPSRTSLSLKVIRTQSPASLGRLRKTFRSARSGLPSKLPDEEHRLNLGHGDVDQPPFAVQHLNLTPKVAVGVEKTLDEPIIELSNDYALTG